MKTSKWMAAIAAFAVLCSGDLFAQVPGGRTIVEGQVVSRSADDSAVMTWNLCDPIGDDRMGARLSDDGRFRFEADGITRFHNATLNYGRFINFFVAPGDSVHLVIDAAKLRVGAADAVCFGGDRAAENAQLYAYHSQMIPILNADSSPLDMEAAPQTMVAALKTRVARYEDSLACQSPSLMPSLTPLVRDFMRRDLVFCVANQLLGYKQEDPAARSALFGDPFFGVHDSANFCTMMFPYHLGTYMQTKVYADTTLVAAGRRGDFVTAVRRGVGILLAEPATASRDVMLWQFLSKFIELTPALCDSVPEIRTVFIDPTLNDRLAAMARKSGEVPVFPDTPLKGVAYLTGDSTVMALPEGDMFAYLAEKHPGKVLYVDVYATWCGPCRAELVPARELHRLMEGKDVVFVNLCLGSASAEWRKMVAQQGVEGENYWFDGDATQLFLGTYNLPGYPTYILVGKEGRIVTMQAERPSALTQVARQIDDLLAQ